MSATNNGIEPYSAGAREVLNLIDRELAALGGDGRFLVHQGRPVMTERKLLLDFREAWLRDAATTAPTAPQSPLNPQDGIGSSQQESCYVSTVRRRLRRKAPRPVTNPKDVYRLIRPLVRKAEQEHFYCLHLNNRHLVAEVSLISLGTLSASLVHPREVFRDAIRRATAAVIVCHNHPSGDPEPSEDDKEITRRLADTGELVGIPLLDHIIIGDGHYTSCRELWGKLS